MSISRSRRRLLVAAGLSALPAASFASSAPSYRPLEGDKARAIAFEHTHTGEKVAVTYAYGDAYVPAALQSLTWLLRDFRTGATHPIDPALFDQLHALAGVTRSQAPFQVISGYRSPATNTMLRQHGGGVASQSLHLKGQAIDIRLSDVKLADLRDAALSLRAGGVGFYPGSDFVHVDTGRVRRW
jgi:uncharacterized protein YcbK (DUF882 family)